MRVLFVGDGRHDIGPGDGTPRPRTARGVVPALSRKIVPAIAADSKAITWGQVLLFATAAELIAGHHASRSEATHLGLARKAKRCVTIAKVHDCVAIVCVVDGDGKERERLDELEGAARSMSIATACGVAIRTIEAWSLGSPEAIAGVLDVSVDDVRERIPAQPERLNPNSGKPEHRSKDLLHQLAELGDRTDSTELREEIAEATDTAKLEHTCPGGFAPFVAELRRLAAKHP